MSEFSIEGYDRKLGPDKGKNITTFTWMESLQTQMKHLLGCKIFIILWKSITLIMTCFLFLPDCLNHIVFLCLWFQQNSVHRLLSWNMDLFKLVMKDLYLSFTNILCSKFYLSTVVTIHVFFPWWNSAKNILCMHFSFSSVGFRLTFVL